METAPLKSFATKARADLIKEVGARATVILAKNSLARVESAAAVRALEGAIARDGFDQVIDRVAYTWFNRIIALRFMDANGYTPSGVISPEAGHTTGQPVVLAEAKAGIFDSTVVPTKTQETITAFLNGTRPSQDPQGEAYGLLVEAYCRHWHGTMPFMFEREGDYTELLIPTALLAPESVRDRAVRTLTEEVCREVEVIGWLYQFYISDRKSEVFDGFKKNRKAGPAELPAATQLFTPHWIVRYLVENSLGGLWLLNNPSSQLAEQMDYFIKPIDEETDFLRISKPEDLKVIDPAVGSGHMLTYAFDLLYSIYAEKGYDPVDIPGLILQHNLYGTEIDPRAGALAAFALVMKAAAKRKQFLKNPVQPNIRVLENVHFDQGDLNYLWSLTRDISVARQDFDAFWNAFANADVLGSLIQPRAELARLLKPLVGHLEASGNLLARPVAKVLEQSEFLSREYETVVANPPYMGRTNMGDALVQLADETYPSTKSDLYTMFMARAEVLTRPGGSWGVISPHGWMFQSSFARWRGHFLARNRVSSLVQLGRGIFGSDWATAMFVSARARPTPNTRAVYRKLFERALDVRSRELLERLFLDPSYQVFSVRQNSFLEIDGNPLAFGLGQAVLTLLASSETLASHASPKQGLITGDNDRFLRFWWEVSATRITRNAEHGRDVGRGAPWVPYLKGGPPRRWSGNEIHVVQWANDGYDIRNLFGSNGRQRSRPQNTESYFRPGLTWSTIAGEFAVRVAEAGSIFDQKGSLLLLRRAQDLTRLLGYLNSRLAGRIIGTLSPTLDFSQGSVGRIPVPEGVLHEPDVDDAINECVTISRADWATQEVASDFSPRIGGRPLSSRLSLELAAAANQLHEAVSRIELLEHAIDSHFDRLSGGLATSDVSRRATLIAADLADMPQSKLQAELVRDFISYSVGCMFGRYSLDSPGLILADQRSTLQDFLAKIPAPSFMPDSDNVIPIVDGDWFEDDIVARFRLFLRAGFGEEHFVENLRFVTESLGVKDVRDYFVKSFYSDHIKRYKKRPIYWLFRSPTGSFSALIYLHRYNPTTVSTVLTGYLREFIGKLEANLEHQGRVAAGMGGASARDIASALKEADRIRNVLVELRDYEREILFPLAGQQIDLELDDGVLVNYQKLGSALKDIGLKKGDGE